MTNSIDELVELLAEYKNVKILILNRNKYGEWLNNHPLVNQLIDRIELTKPPRSVDISTKLGGKPVYLGKQLKAKVISQKGMSLVEESYEDAKSKLEDYMLDMLEQVSEESLGVANKWSISGTMVFYYVRQYVFVLETMSKLGILEYKHTRPIEHFQGWMEEITEIGLTQGNWKEHQSILQDVPKVSEWTAMMDFLEDKADSDLALDLVLKDYLRMIYQSANNYREINKWENNEEFLRELPDMLRRTLGAMK
jgi:hypothetical protein